MSRKDLYCKRCGCKVWEEIQGDYYHCLMVQHDNGGCPKNCYFPLGVIPKKMVTAKPINWDNSGKFVDRVMQEKEV